MHIPDPDASSVVVIGASRTDDDSLPDVRPVRRGAVALHNMLTDSPAALFIPGRSGSLLVDPDDNAVLDALGEAAARTTDTLVVHFAGHGVRVGSELHLVTRTADRHGTAPGHIPWTTVLSLLSRSRARHKLVILDCAFSELAVRGITLRYGPSAADRLGDLRVLTSASADPVASAGLGAEFPALTGSLVSLLRQGMDGPGQFLTVEQIWRDLHEPQTDPGPGSAILMASTMGAETDLALARNVRYAGAPSVRHRRPPQPRWTVTAFAGESDHGPDLLGIAEDTLALAVLISARTLQPPLALGLFGDWGSGKTFFMRRLENDIQQLTSGPVVHRRGRDGERLEPAFCRRVVSVWFNAWHYAEANLWASLVHHIFDSLNGRADAPGRLLEEAMEQIQGIQETRAAAVADTRTAEHLAADARSEVHRITREHRRARAAAAGLRARDLRAGLRVDGPALAAFNEATGALGLDPVGAGAREVAAAVAETRELADSARRLSTAGPWYRTPLFLGTGTAALLTAGGFLASTLVDWPAGWAAAATAAGAQAVGLGSGALAWVRRQAGLARTLLGPATALQQQLDARLAELATVQERETEAAQQRLDLAAAELTAAREALTRATERERAARDALDRLTGERLLERYLADRVASADYGRYLGVVALAHRDLRDLESFLRKAATENGAGIDRIVLYIDDLDRCPPKVVATVLEAVHLLLALPLFVVVVGVDSRWLSRSLLHEHPLLLSGPGTPAGAGGADGPGGYEGPGGPGAPGAHRDPARDRGHAHGHPHGHAQGHADPAAYLDKIFQLSYTLPAMTRESSVELLRQTALAGQPDDAETNAPVPDQPLPGTSPEARQAQDAAASPAEAAASRLLEEAALGAAALALTSGELDLLELVAPLVGSSPRRAKRFLNVYRVMKARSGSDEALGPGPALMLVTALVVAFPTVAPAALAAAQEDGLPVRSWLATEVRRGLDAAGAGRLDAFLAVASGAAAPSEAVTAMGAVAALTVGELRGWLPLVRRFAWPLAP